MHTQLYSYTAIHMCTSATYVRTNIYPHNEVEHKCLWGDWMMGQNQSQTVAHSRPRPSSLRTHPPPAQPALPPLLLYALYPGSPLPNMLQQQQQRLQHGAKVHMELPNQKLTDKRNK